MEIDHGPYLVKPIDQANDTGERPLNIDRTHIVWLDASETTLIEASERQEPSLGPKIAFLWENDGLTGRLIKLSAGYNGYIKGDGDIFHAIVITDKPLYQVNENIQPQALGPGSHFASTAKSIYAISLDGSEESIIYIRSNDRF